MNRAIKQLSYSDSVVCEAITDINVNNHRKKRERKFIAHFLRKRDEGQEKENLCRL